LNESLESLAQFLHAAVHSGFRDLDGPREEKNGFSFFENADVKKVTGEHYGQLFKAFANTSYWDEPVKLLRQRLEKNGIAATDFQDKSVLDAGCGGGRYSVAWRLLGARPVVGFDISTTGITDARHRIAEVGIDDVHFEQGNVLELPFDDNTFDVVFSNGVLHHTTNWQQGVNEVVRVLRPNGFGWLYVIENPGGLYWDLIEVLRVVMKDEQHDVARSALQILDVPANRIFYMLDHVMVPINVRLTPEETEEGLRAAGATKIRRLERGTDFDLIERIYQKEPFAEIKYGVGENRYVFTKE
jgi:ubiquinone/menaquinone biosynthesis C-methylase UbiE